jgi:hypothetical protein
MRHHGLQSVNSLHPIRHFVGVCVGLALSQLITVAGTLEFSLTTPNNGQFELWVLDTDSIGNTGLAGFSVNLDGDITGFTFDPLNIVTQALPRLTQGFDVVGSGRPAGGSYNIYGVQTPLNFNRPIYGVAQHALTIPGATDKLVLGAPLRIGTGKFQTELPVFANVSGTVFTSARDGTAIDATAIVSSISTGDLDSNGTLNEADIEILCEQIHDPRASARYDLNADGIVDLDDLRYWVEEIKGTSIGDANLDGTFGTGDLISVFTAGQYEDQIDDNSVWTTGDWNCDEDFTTGDMVYAFQYGDYEPLSRASVAQAVPEPGLIGIWLTMVVSALRRGRHGFRGAHVNE